MSPRSAQPITAPDAVRLNDVSGVTLISGHPTTAHTSIGYTANIYCAICFSVNISHFDCGFTRIAEYGFTRNRLGSVTATVWFIRPPDIVVGGLRFYRDSFSSSSFSIFFFFRQSLFDLAERNSTKTGHMLGSECDLQTHVRNLGYIFPTPKIGSPETAFFRRLRNFNGLYLRNGTGDT